jgi:hypothetical protein
VSTSAENVDTGEAATEVKLFSFMVSYSSVLKLPGAADGYGIQPGAADAGAIACGATPAASFADAAAEAAGAAEAYGAGIGA